MNQIDMNPIWEITSGFNDSIKEGGAQLFIYVN